MKFFFIVGAYIEVGTYVDVFFIVGAYIEVGTYVEVFFLLWELILRLGLSPCVVDGSLKLAFETNSILKTRLSGKTMVLRRVGAATG